MNDFEQEGSTEPEDEVAPSNEEVELTDSLEELSEDELDRLIAGEEPAEDVPPDEQDAPEAKEEPKAEKPEATPQQLQEDLEKANERIANLTKELGRRSSEIGTLRAALREQAQVKEQEARELEIDQPVAAMKAMLEVERLKEQDKQLASEEEEVTRRAAFYERVPNVLRPEEFDIEAIRTELRLDGVPEDRIENFISRIDRQNPDLVIMASKRAYYAKALTKLVPKIKELMDENQRLKSSSKTQGEQLAQKISQQLKKPLAVPVSRAPVAKARVDDVTLDSLSDAELDELINKGTLNGIDNI